MKDKLLYWIPTVLLALMMTGGGIVDVLRTPDVVKVIGQLGYPTYFPVMLGVAKLLGVAALLVPGVPRTLKEWAYAGFTFDVIAAMVSIMAVGNPVSELVPPAIALVLTTVSGWAWRKRRP